MSPRKGFAIVVLSALVLASPGVAQTVKVVDKPGEGQWTISYSRKNGPSDFELDTSKKTKVEALREANRLKVWSDSMPAGSGWRLAVILIEGEDAGFANDALELAKKFQEAKEAVDKAKKIGEEGLTAEERKLGDTLKEYADHIKEVYQRAVTAKQYLTSMTGTILQKQFQDVNNLIDRFNQTRQDFRQQAQPAPGSRLLPLFSSTLTQYPEIARVTPQDLKGKLDSDTSSGKYTVWVFKLEGGQWVKQAERTLGTDDEEKARKYVENFKSVQGWMATSNLPAREVPRLDGTAWTGPCGGPFRFEAGGVLSHTCKQHGTFTGTWKQTGASLYMEVNNRFWEYEGSIQGDRIVGRDHNKLGKSVSMVLTK